jgi:uncharacterized membrane protein
MVYEPSEKPSREIETILKEADPKTFESLDPKERQKVAQLVSVVFQRHFSGPLPPPEILAQYNEIVPGAAERILKMAEEQSAHRRGLEDKTIRRNWMKVAEDNGWPLL